MAQFSLRGFSKPRFCGLTLAALFFWPTTVAFAQETLTAKLSLHDPITNEPISADGKAPVRLRVALTDPVTGRPPRGIDLLGWVRALDVNDPTCEKAAQNFRTTQKLPLGSVDLNGILIATQNRDSSISVIDPKLNLFSSNLVAAHLLEFEPADMAIDSRHMRTLFALPEEGQIIAASLMGPERTTIVDALSGVQSLAVTENGIIWAGDSQGGLIQISQEGIVKERLELSDGAVNVDSSSDPDNEVIGAYTSDGAVLMIHGASSRIFLQSRFSLPVADVSFVGDIGALAVLKNSTRAELRYVDAPDVPLTIELGTGFSRIETGPDSRIAIAYAPGSSVVAILDMAVGRVVQSLALNDATVSEITFTDNAAYVLSHDGGFVGVIDLATVALGKAAVLRQANLGVKTSRPSAPSRLLVPLFPSPQVLAGEPENQTGWLVQEAAASVEMPPMDSIRLRGGVPQRVHMIDRSFKEVEAGVFETVWAFAPGQHQLILTTFGLEISTCIPFSVRGPVEQLSLTPVQLEIESDSLNPVAGQPHEIGFKVTGPGDEILELSHLTLLIPSMVSGWNTRVRAQADQDGILRAQITFPHIGPYALQPIDLPHPLALRAGFIVEAVAQKEKVQ